MVLGFSDDGDVGLLHKILKLNESKRQDFRTQVRPTVKQCSLVCFNMRQCDKGSSKNAPRCIHQAADKLFCKPEWNGTPWVAEIRFLLALIPKRKPGAFWKYYYWGQLRPRLVLETQSNAFFERRISLLLAKFQRHGIQPISLLLNVRPYGPKLA